MQIKTSHKKQFEPITIEITIESQKESKALYTVFNFCGIFDYLRSQDIQSTKILDALPQCDSDVELLQTYIKPYILKYINQKKGGEKHDKQDSHYAS